MVWSNVGLIMDNEMDNSMEDRIEWIEWISTTLISLCGSYGYDIFSVLIVWIICVCVWYELVFII